MAATRFYFPAEGAGVPNISPAFNAGWEQTGEATRLTLDYKRNLSVLSVLADNGTRAVPITTTQDILCNQFVSGPIPPQTIDTSCLFSATIRALEAAATANVTLAVVAYVVSQDGGTVRGTLYSNFSTGTEFNTSTEIRIIPQTAVTAVTTQPGDRIVVEVGGHAAAPSGTTTYTMRQGYSAASDIALFEGSSAAGNLWCEFSADLFASPINNFQFPKAGDGISVTEKIR